MKELFALLTGMVCEIFRVLEKEIRGFLRKK